MEQACWAGRQESKVGIRQVRVMGCMVEEKSGGRCIGMFTMLWEAGSGIIATMGYGQAVICRLFLLLIPGGDVLIEALVDEGGSPFVWDTTFGVNE